jgi:hypothetical protein
LFWITLSFPRLKNYTLQTIVNIVYNTLYDKSKTNKIGQ